MSVIMSKISQFRRSKWAFPLCYTALFLLCALLCLGYFVLADRSLVWSGTEGYQDGIGQHYIALSYWGDYLREIIRTLLTEGRWSVPTFDTSIGLGGDVIQTLSYYVIGDPLTLLSALVPREYTEYLYDFLIIFRMYLAGLAFSAFALHLKKNHRLFVLIGAMVYVFSGYTTHFGLFHPYFLNPLIYLPLILLGAEYIFEKKKPWLFILSIMMAAVCNFYFFYMIAIITVIYVLVRMFDYLPGKTVGNFVKQLLPFAGYAVVGVLMACVLFLPSAMTVLGSNRASAESYVPLFYSLRDYLHSPVALNTPIALSNETQIGHLPIVSLALILLWRRKKERTVKILLGICLLFLIFPVFGWFLNGMSYVTNRWTWALSLVLGIICTFYLPDLPKLSSRTMIGSLCGAAFLSLLGILVQRESNVPFIAMFNLLLVFVLPTLLHTFFSHKKYFVTLCKSTLLLLTILCAGGMGYARFVGAGYLYYFMDNGTCLDSVRSAQGNPLNTLEDTSFYRFEDYTEDARSVPRNATLLNGGNSTNCFFSLSSPTWYEMLRSVGYRHPLEQDVQGTDNCTIIGMLSNVKYFTGEQEKQSAFLPYGYNREPIMSNWLDNHRLNAPNHDQYEPEFLLYDYYENDLALPFGYTYEGYITREEYNTLSFNQRQTALLHAAVLEEENDLLPKVDVPTDTEHAVDFTVEYSEHVKQQGTTYIVSQANQWITLKLKNTLPQRETYLTLIGANYKQIDPYEQATLLGTLGTMSQQEIKALKKQSFNFKQKDTVVLTARMEEAAKNIRFYSSTSFYNTGIRDVCTNLGYLEKAPDEIRLRFNSPGVYTIEELAVSQLDLSSCKERQQQMSKEHLENVVLGDNVVSGDITVSENKLLCLSLPYSEGWTAYVDGKQVQLHQTDIAFMGIALEKGSHKVELRYQTPYLRAGKLLSLAGFAIFLALILFHYRKKIFKKPYLSRH